MLTSANALRGPLKWRHPKRRCDLRLALVNYDVELGVREESRERLRRDLHTVTVLRAYCPGVDPNA